MCTVQSLFAAGHSCLQPSFLILCSPKPKISPCHLYWKSDYEILIGWADRVKVRMLLETTRQHIHHTTSIPSHATCVTHHITSCHTLPVLHTTSLPVTRYLCYTPHHFLSHATCVTHHITPVTRYLCYTPHHSCHTLPVLHTTSLLSHATCVTHHITSCHTLPVLHTTSLPVTRYLCYTPHHFLSHATCVTHHITPVTRYLCYTPLQYVCV